MRSLIRRLLPKTLVSWYHLGLAYAGAVWYGFPARKMVIVGVLGTRGKTTTANLIWACTTAAGYKTGLTGTANIRIGNKERLNPYHMTMPGRFELQRLLRSMVRAGCEIAVVETPSEGVEQWRHIGIAYDIAVMTSLYPEYVAAHNWDFERCKTMHRKVFQELHAQPRKILRGKPVEKTIIVNADIAEKDLFLDNPADRKKTYAVQNGADERASNIESENSGVAFSVGAIRYKTNLIGAFNVGNALAAVVTAQALQIAPEAIQRGLRNLPGVPGRMERIDAGQSFSVFVDYAHDAVSLETVLKTAEHLRESNNQKIIVVTGGQGGGRDRKKRPLMGRIAAMVADYVIIANEDPYEENPKTIMEEIAKGSEHAGKVRDENLFLFDDRREGIRKALSLAHSDDLVFITGKGAEQSMMTGKQSVPWDDRTVVREELAGITP